MERKKWWYACRLLRTNSFKEQEMWYADPVLGHGSANKHKCNNSTAMGGYNNGKRSSLCSPYYSCVTQQQKYCWERCLLCDLCQGYIRSRFALWVSLAVGSQLVQLRSYSWKAPASEDRSQDCYTTEGHYQAVQWRPWWRTLVCVW
jgi:hypothetical protein